VVIPRIPSTPLIVIATSVLLGIIIGVTEEVLWRGVYVTLFPDRLSLNTVYPSIMFGLWHVCPLAVVSSRYPGGSASFAAYAIALGFSYSYCARTTGSIRWCTVSHCVHDALGLGAFAYARWL
jgi:membrane protease YdiL (CAAX protease family)